MFLKQTKFVSIIWVKSDPRALTEITEIIVGVRKGHCGGEIIKYIHVSVAKK